MAFTLDFPSETTAGLNFSASIDAPDYPAPVWTLELIMRGPGQMNLVAVDGAFYATAADTAAWQPGLYSFSVRATDGTNKVELGNGQVTVIPDLATVTGSYDGRSDNEKALEAIEAVLGNRATLDQDRYKINNRELWRTPITELLRLQSFYKMRVRRERLKAKGVSTLGRAVAVRFS